MFAVGQTVESRFPNIRGAVIKRGKVVKISTTGQVTVDLANAGKVRFTRSGDEIGANKWWVGSIKVIEA